MRLLTGKDIENEDDDYKDDWGGAKASRSRQSLPIVSKKDIAQCENTGPSPIVLVLVVVLVLGLRSSLVHGR
jgi:hypothetical protein